MRQHIEQMDFSTILANSIHDMKNSLAILQVSLDDIVNSDTIADQHTKDQLNHLRYEGNRLNNNLVQLLTIYRLKNTQLDLHITKNSLDELLEECLIINQELLATKHISISYECPTDMNAYFDREMLLGIINNVINNAFKYTKDKIHITIESNNHYVIIAIKDNGSGYSEDMLFQHSNHLSEVDFHSGSTGLGLYFASLIAKGHRYKDNEGFISRTNEGIDGGGNLSIYIPCHMN